MIKTNVKLEVLETAVNDYFQSEEEWRMFLKTWQGGWWETKTAKQHEDYTKYNERNSGAWNTIITLCRLLSIDEKSLFAIVKANNRYTTLRFTKSS